jgi:hypothetical protein
MVKLILTMVTTLFNRCIHKLERKPIANITHRVKEPASIGAAEAPLSLCTQSLHIPERGRFGLTRELCRFSALINEFVDEQRTAMDDTLMSFTVIPGYRTHLP